MRGKWVALQSELVYSIELKGFFLHSFGPCFLYDLAYDGCLMITAKYDAQCIWVTNGYAHVSKTNRPGRQVAMVTAHLSPDNKNKNTLFTGPSSVVLILTSTLLHRGWLTYPHLSLGISIIWLIRLSDIRRYGSFFYCVLFFVCGLRMRIFSPACN